MRRVSLAAGLLLASLAAHADEGMWMPSQLPDLAPELKGLGLETPPAELADLTSHPMNAIIGLGFCSASFVSPKGLAVTNHHCAYSAIQYNSTEDNDLLEQGFSAAKLEDEVPARPNMRIYVTDAITDVTDRVTDELSGDMDGKARYDAIQSKRKELVADCEEKGSYHCEVHGFHYGLEYFLVRQLEIRDVRLVYAPPESIGKFGGDVDNWQWPRHTGDFAFFRAYVGPDGQPADHHEDNVPFEPDSHLAVGAEGVKPGDFAMVAGYPGSTERYQLAAELEHAIEWSYPTRIETYNDWLDIIHDKAESIDGVELTYARTIAGLNNAEKNYRGMLEGFEDIDGMAAKRDREDDLVEWLAGRDDGEDSIEEVRALQRLVAEANRASRRETLYRWATSSDLLEQAQKLYRLSLERRKPDIERKSGFQERDLPFIEGSVEELERTFHPAVDRALWTYNLKRYFEQPAEHRHDALEAWFGAEDEAPGADRLRERLDAMYEATSFTGLEERQRWLEAEPEEFENSDDPFIRLAVALHDTEMALEDEQDARRGRFQRLRSKFMTSLIELKESRGEPVYPDANGSLRVSYGTVRGYEPRDAVFYEPFTSLDGVRDKTTGEPPFDSPPALLEAIPEAPDSPYYRKWLDSVPVNFLADLDITGGNSGSAVLNGRAELVGLAFDGNWKSIISDWLFNPEASRAIQVDVRYMLWIMDEVFPNQRLLEEMNVDAS